ncbi:nucleotidase [Halalkalibacterium halodurans]|jgi:uncharacterized HAD superfamily protein|uniref:Putative nucleotidase BH1399 n=2 Tax=Halalkalibacterium halodurans TaxID=86665 RepID=Y1399_HALH5|nr:nucleotidase [Halalkalibacterium halodurans]Q9KD20.1 RecName: Full=Putative nucleotidase BH1399 [Halalkalibacterium halodurans C-125]MED3647046.1 nucleotidase [Halalkalibacterium halodurans]MED4124825.1 nucleotidase [Halalkalibacterium halodurans]MED4163970.1 nucleotidase [Halalkalibacterium halodurans]MED4174246.1 nucleotidase [Halalkalibacterium halodurans]TPE69320.1 nucleotidase [Halalkalibacterium halodurans]
MTVRKQKRFGLDIDGTVTDPATFLPYLNEQFQKTLTLEDITDYDLTKSLGITSEEFWKWMEQHEQTIYKQAKKADGVDQVLEEWKQEHELIYITARASHLEEITKNWFEQQNLPFHHIELVGKHDKIEAIRTHEIDIFFEDKHDNAVAIAETFAIPVILMDTPYNRLPTPANVVRINHWTEAKAWVDEWLKRSGF